MKNLNFKRSILATVMVTGMITSTGAAIQKTNESGPVAISSYSESSKVADHELEIWHAWRDGGAQQNALNKIVDTWNSTMADTAGFTVKSTYIGSYGDVVTSIQNNIEAGSISDLPNFYISYSGATSSLLQNARGLSLALDYTQEQKDSQGNTIEGISSDVFIEQMLTSNYNIAGSTGEGLYTMPMSSSSEFLAINVPLLVWALQQYEAAGGTVDATGSTVDKILDAADGARDGVQGTINISNDVDSIEEKWEAIAGATTGNTITITDSTFESVTELEALCRELLTVIEPTGSSADQGLLAFDSISNQLYLLGQAITGSGSDETKGMITLSRGETPQDDIVHYNMYGFGNEGEDTTLQEEAYAKIYNFFIDGFEAGTIWAGDGYGSDKFYAHQLMFSVGSTSGAGYYAKPEWHNNEGTWVDQTGMVNSTDMVLVQSPGHFDSSDAATDSVRMQQGPGFGGIDKGKEGYKGETGDTLEFMNWLVTEDKVISEDIDGDGTEETMTPADYMSVKSGYIVGTKSVITGTGSSQFEQQLDAARNQYTVVNDSDPAHVTTSFAVPTTTIGASIAYDNFANTDGKSELEFEPYSYSTDAVRNEGQALIKQQFNSVSNGDTPLTASEASESMDDYIITNGLDTGVPQTIFGNDGLSWWAILLIVIASLTVIGLIGFLVWYFVFNKKSESL